MHATEREAVVLSESARSRVSEKRDFVFVILSCMDFCPLVVTVINNTTVLPLKLRLNQRVAGAVTHSNQ